MNLANAVLQLKKDRDQAQRRLGNWMRRLRLWPGSVAHADDLRALTRPTRGGGRYQRQLIRCALKCWRAPRIIATTSRDPWVLRLGVSGTDASHSARYAAPSQPRQFQSGG